jgi:hypothetical protein
LPGFRRPRRSPSVIDARGQQGSARQLLELNALVSLVAAVALGSAAGGDKGDVLPTDGDDDLCAAGEQSPQTEHGCYHPRIIERVRVAA